MTIYKIEDISCFYGNKVCTEIQSDVRKVSEKTTIILPPKFFTNSLGYAQ